MNSALDDVLDRQCKLNGRIHNERSYQKNLEQMFILDEFTNTIDQRASDDLVNLHDRGLINAMIFTSRSF